VILPKERDPRFITVRRGGSLSDPDHHLLAIWAADCAQHVLHHVEQVRPGDDRPRRAIELARAWARGEIPMKQAHDTAFIANAAVRDVSGAAKMAAIAAEAPYQAVFKNDRWIVTGTLARRNVGGTALAVIAKKDGRIIKVYHTR